MSGAGAQVREIVRPGTAFTALWSGSVVLAGLVCRCGGRVAGWAWDVASVDTEATAAVQAKADKAARAKAAKARKAAKAKADQDDDAEDDDQEQDDDAEAQVMARPVRPVRRPVVESLGLAAFGGLLVSGAAGTAGTLLWPYVQQLGPYQGVLATAGGLGWAVAAWMLAPAPEVEDDDQEPDAEEQPEEENAEAAEPAPDRGTALLWHVVGALAEAEASGRAGVHLDVVLASAVAAGLLAQGTEQGELRAWVEGCGLPTADKVGMRIGGKPVTRVGLRIDAATAALGMSPAALLRARSQTPATAPGETPAAAAVPPALVPAQAVGERFAEAPATTPAEAPAPASVSTPVSAALRLIPGGLLDPDSAPSPALSQGQGRGVR